MKRGEMCESCGNFSDGTDNVVPCSICGKDMCGYCANEQLCEECFDRHGEGILGYEPWKEPNSDITLWRKVTGSGDKIEFNTKSRTVFGFTTAG